MIHYDCLDTMYNNHVILVTLYSSHIGYWRGSRKTQSKYSFYINNEKYILDNMIFRNIYQLCNSTIILTIISNMSCFKMYPLPTTYTYK